MARGERAASTRRAFRKLRPDPLGSQAAAVSRTLQLPLEEPAAGAARELWLAFSEVDARQQGRLLSIAQDFSSQVSIEPPDGVLFEAGRSRQFFGGLRSLLAKLQLRCQQVALAPRWGLAPTPLAALALARAISGRVVLQRAHLVGTQRPRRSLRRLSAPPAPPAAILEVRRSLCRLSAAPALLADIPEVWLSVHPASAQFAPLGPTPLALETRPPPSVQAAQLEGSLRAPVCRARASARRVRLGGTAAPRRSLHRPSAALAPAGATAPRQV